MTPHVRRVAAAAVPMLLLGAAVGFGGLRVRRARLDAELIAAVHAKDTPRAADLLARGADPNARPTSAAPGIQGLVDALLGRKRAIGPPVLAEAADAQEWEIARALLARGADPNVQGNSGWSALGSAIAFDDPEHAAARDLVKHGADPNALADPERRTPLMLAASAGDYALMDELLRRGARVDATDGAGRNVLTWLSGHRESADTLRLARAALDRGARPEAAENLTWAARAGNTGMLRLLLDRGAAHGYPPRSDDEYVTWALREAVRAGHEDASRLLLNVGANPISVEDDAPTPALRQLLRQAEAERTRQHKRR